MPPRPRFAPVALILALASASLAAQQYKVIGADGRVTYTDRPPVDSSLRVLEVGKPDSVPALGPEASLPPDLRRLVERFPVVLFTSAQCAPCDSARDYLRQRGIPFRERLILDTADIAALERAVGGRTMPAMTVGSQALSGYAVADWTSYLDVAGYPRESRLPANWKAPAPAPLVAKAPTAPKTDAPAAPSAQDEPAPDSETAPAPVPAPAPAGGPSLRF